MGREEIGREGVKERGGGGSHDFSSSSPIKSHVAKFKFDLNFQLKYVYLILNSVVCPNS